MDSSWWELCIQCTPTLEDLIFWRLENIGCRGTASDLIGDQLRIRAYLHQEQLGQVEFETLHTDLAQDAQSLNLPVPQITRQMIQEEDWAHAWKQYWHPQAIGDRLLINPAWLPMPDPQENPRLVLQLDPGVAFGTGSHATTQMCLEALELYLNPVPADPILADIGCGSGILSIAAVLLGVSQVYAVDLDPLAVQSTQDNWALNQLPREQLWVAQGSVDCLPQGIRLTGLVCNILAPVIIDLMPQLTAIAPANTWMILSGLLVSQAPAVIEAAQQQGWQLDHEWHQGEWACLGVHR